MGESTGGPGLPAAAPGPELVPEDGATDWGRLLDAAGIVAGIVLLVIVADVWSDGRLVSRHLHRKPGGDAGDNPGE